MSSPMNTDVAAQAASSTKIQGLADEMQGILGRLQGEADATAAVWAGGAHTAFMGGTTQIHADLQAGQVLMTDVSTKVGQNGVTYGSTDEQSQGALSSTGL